MTDRFGDWQTSFTGRRFHPLDLGPEEVCIEDIAHGLALVNRYGGHTREPISVAQHSVIVSYQVPLEHALEGLLHDAHEAYLGDTPKPRKAALFALLPEGYVPWKEIERRAQRAIMRGLDLEHMVDIESEAVARVDNAILANEHRDCFGAPFDESCTWRQSLPALPNLRIDPWGEKEAEAMFLRRYHALRSRCP